MHAIKSARHLITQDPSTATAKTLAQLVLALESESPFDISSLYALDIDSFQMAISILEEWRLDRYYAGKAKLFDVAFQANELAGPRSDRH
jgi:hypothetical protein